MYAEQNETVAEQYIATFCGRTDAFNAFDGSWHAIREDLTPRVLISAFKKKRPISGYFIHAANLTHVAAVDFDSDDGYDQARALRTTLSAQGMTGYVEPSRRGAHLWCVLDEVLTAKTVRRALRGFLAAALIPEGPKVEIRPGEDQTKPGGLGSCLRLPTMHHPTTGRRYPLLGADDQPIGGTLAEILLNFDYADAGGFRRMADRYVPPFDPKDVLPELRRPKHYQDDDTASASDILARLWGVADARPGHSVRCPAHDDIFPSLSILQDDARALCKAPGCPLNNDGHGRGTHELTVMAPNTANG